MRYIILLLVSLSASAAPMPESPEVLNCWPNKIIVDKQALSSWRRDLSLDDVCSCIGKIRRGKCKLTESKVERLNREFNDRVALEQLINQTILVR